MTALITPFRDDGVVDEGGLRQNIRFQLEGGVDALLALGSTGEGEALGACERLSVIQVAKEETQGKVALWAHTGDSTTERTIKKTKEAEAAGVDGVLIITPYHCLPTQEGVVAHFRDVAQSTKLPIIIYHHPKRSSTSLEVSTLQRLSQIDNIVGVKDASGDVGFVARLLWALPDLDIFAGDDLLSLPLLSIGAKGVISVMSNVMPQKMCELVSSREKALYYELLPFFQFSQCESNPIPIKAMMHSLNMPSGRCRLPLTPLSRQYREQMHTLLLSYV